MPIFNKIKSKVGKSLTKFDMIHEGDKILVGFSGGKDSFALLEVLLYFQKTKKINFKIIPVIIDNNFDKIDYKRTIEYFKERKLDYHIEYTKIADVVKKEMAKDEKYCFLCSRLRRGILYKLATDFDCNKIALGHNLDDAMQTYLMNILYSSKTEPLKPSYVSDDGKYIVIRPLIHVREDFIVEYVKDAGFNIIKKNCVLKPENSKREEIKTILDKLGHENSFIYSSMQISLDKIFSDFLKKKNSNKK